MPLILAIEPDKRQAAQLKVLVKNRLHADLVLADTTELALEAIGNRIPDLVLVPALLSPEEDGALNAALRVIAAAAHVQTLTIPVFASASTKKATVKTGGLLSKLLTNKSEGAPEGCDPAVFGDQIAAYLAEIAADRDARGFDDDDFEDAPAKPAAAFARVETFAPPQSFEAAVEDFKSDALEAGVEEEPAEAAPIEEPAIVEPPVEVEAAPESIFREPDEPVAEPSPERKSVFDSLFKRRERKPAPPVEPDWPVYEPAATPEPVEEPATEPATESHDDWAPPRDQSIGVDLPGAHDEQPAIAASPEVEESVDPREEAVWEEHESSTDATWPLPPLDMTPPSRTVRRNEPAPADLLEEFTADLAATRARLKPQAPPEPNAVPPAKPPVSARAAAPAAPKPQAAARQAVPAKAQPPAAAPAAPVSAKATKHQASTPFKKTERPEWSALIDSLRQDMERMRQERGDRSKEAAPAPPPPPVEEPVRYTPPPKAPQRPPAPTPAPAPVQAQTRAPVAPKRPVKNTPVQDEWGVLHDGNVNGKYATKESAFESAVAAASLALRQGHEVHVSVPAREEGQAAMHSRPS